MGRVKLKIKRLESNSNRQVTYSKRRSGILKKAKEISVLCDIDIMLLMFSPNGKPTMFCGARSLDEIISKFAQLSPQDRAKRKLESLEVLKKTFKKLDHDINIHEFLDTSTPSVEELCNQVSLLRGQLTDVHNRLSWWSNPEKIEDVEHLRQMESSLRESLSKVHAHKENFTKHQLMPSSGPSELMSSNSFENAMQFPITMDDHQQDPGLPWIPNNDNLLATMPENPHYLSRRDLEYPGDLSIPSCSGLFSTGKGSEIDSTAFIDNINSSRDFSLPCASGFVNRNVEETDDIQKMKIVSKEASVLSCSSFLNYGKEFEVDRAGQVDNLTREGSAMDDLNAIACLRLQLGGQHPYYPFSNLNVPDMRNLEVGRAVNFQENPINYQTPGNVELPRSIIENSSHTWTPASNNCDINMINEISFPQTANHP